MKLIKKELLLIKPRACWWLNDCKALPSICKILLDKRLREGAGKINLYIWLPSIEKLCLALCEVCKITLSDINTRARARNLFAKYCQDIAKNSRVGGYLNTPNRLKNGR